MRIAMRVAWCLTGAGWLLPAAAGGQEPITARRPLTLAEARDAARRRSPELQAARHSLATAMGRQRQAGAWPNPTFSYGREETSGDGASNAQDILSLEQPFEIGGQRGARRAAAGLARAVAEARVEAVEARADFEVTRAYAMAVAAERRAALAEQAAAAFGRAVRTSQARLAGGDVSGYEDRRLRLEAARYATVRLEALLARDSVVHALASLMGLADSAGAPESFQLVDTLTPPLLTEPVDSFVALALARRPELRAARLDADVGAAEARLAAAERVPTPVLSGGYKHERQAGAGGLGGFVAGLSIPLPLWDRRGGAVAAARAEAARRTSEAEAMRRQTVREVRAAFDAHQALAGELELLSAQLGEDAAKAHRATEAAYGEGEIGLLEWLDSVRAYHEAETAYATLRAEYLARRAALERATGATLF